MTIRYGMPPRVLVTGASGFIGRHCLPDLQRRGYDVHAVSSREASNEASRATWHTADLLEPGAAERIVAEVEPTHLLHLAWIVAPGELISSPLNVRWVQVGADLVGAFQRLGGERVVVCGSAYEYDWRYGYCSEELTPLAADTLVRGLEERLALPVRRHARRLVDVTGVGARLLPLRAARASCEARALGDPVPLAGEAAACSHGRQVRDYLHVADVASALVTLVDSDLAGARNVCSGVPVTLREVVLSVGAKLDRPDLIKLGAIPARANDAPLVVGDPNRLPDARLAAALRPRQRLDRPYRVVASRRAPRRRLTRDPPPRTLGEELTQ